MSASGGLIKAMFSSVRIEGYRGLRQFEMSGLGRINLLVGKNNCGKTSVLEALYLLLSNGHRDAFTKVLDSRGERSPDFVPEFIITDLPRLFCGGEAGLGSTISIEADDGRATRNC